MAVVLNAKGTSVSSFQIGKQGPLVKNNASIIEFRDKTDTSFIEIKAGGGASPSSDATLVTKLYVDSVASGLDTKNATLVATTSTLASVDASFSYTASDDDGSAEAQPWTSTATTLTIDGVTLVDTDRILVKDETGGTVKGNGVFTITGVGVAIGLKRAADADNTPSNEVSGGMFVFVESGTNNIATGWVMTSPSGNAILGTDDLIFTQFSATGNVTAGDGLTKSGNEIIVVGTASRISVSGAGVDIASNYVGQSSITTLGTIQNFSSTGIDDNATGVAITIDSSQNVGIRTASPNAHLNIIADSFADPAVFRMDASTTSFYSVFKSSNPGSGRVNWTWAVRDNVGATEIDAITVEGSTGNVTIEENHIFKKWDVRSSTAISLFLGLGAVSVGAGNWFYRIFDVDDGWYKFEISGHLWRTSSLSTSTSTGLEFRIGHTTSAAGASGNATTATVNALSSTWLNRASVQWTTANITGISLFNSAGGFGWMSTPPMSISGLVPSGKKTIVACRLDASSGSILLAEGTTFSRLIRETAS